MAVWLIIFFPTGTGIARCANQLSYRPKNGRRRTIDDPLSLFRLPKAEPCITEVISGNTSRDQSRGSVRCEYCIADPTSLKLNGNSEDWAARAAIEYDAAVFEVVVEVPITDLQAAQWNPYPTAA